MKQLISIFLLFMAIATQATSIGYIIEGELTGHDGETFEVFDYDIKKVIGKGIVKDGKLRIAGSYPRNALVRVENGNTFSNCILDTLAILNFDTHSTVGGSELNIKYRDLSQKDKEYDEEFDRFFRELKSHGFSNEEAGEIYKLLYDKKRPDIIAFYTETIKENDNGIGTTFILKLSKFMDLTSDEWDKIYQEMPYNLQNTGTAIDFNEKYKTKRLSEPGKPFIDFDLTELDGRKTRLSDYVGRGKYVLVDFWASWCGPCKREAKEVLSPLYERYKDKENFMILGVATWDEEAKTRESLEKNPTPWHQTLSNENEPMKLYGFDSIPMIILFAPDGTIVERSLRGDQLVKCVEKNAGQP